ncbi:MAG: hypothetical protein EBU93_03300 [Chlamydiae bacterium]|nr:hypothetical protein [Chlamydiota bacterium]
MKKWIPIIGLLAACASAPIMTIDEYTEIQVGTPIKEVEKKYGKPISKKKLDNGVETYEYIERFMMGSQMTEMRRYYIQVKDGKVVGKYYNKEELPPYQDIYTDDPFPEQVQ